MEKTDRMVYEKQQSEEMLRYAYWLHCLNFSNKKLHELTEQIGTPKDIFACGEDKLAQVLREKPLQRLLQSRTNDLHKSFLQLQRTGIQFYPWFHEKYPERLKAIPDRPWAIYVKGNMPEETVPVVAIIGARQCSEYGRMAAKAIGKKLGEQGVCVVSGMAVGIDGIAQESALYAGGTSIAVLGCGADICYPRENYRLYETLQEQGAIVSEYPPGTQPLARLFPPRNRIISGLCDALVVSEAKEKSGTLITVDMALEQGKEVLVLPGRITDALSFGCNKLIKQGAQIVTCMDDIFEVLAEKYRITKGKNIPDGKDNALPWQKSESGLCAYLDYTPKNMEQIWQEYGKENITMQQLLSELLKLCMEGKAKQIGTSFYKTE